MLLLNPHCIRNRWLLTSMAITVGQSWTGSVGVIYKSLSSKYVWFSNHSWFLPHWTYSELTTCSSSYPQEQNKPSQKSVLIMLHCNVDFEICNFNTVVIFIHFSKNDLYAFLIRYKAILMWTVQQCWRTHAVTHCTNNKFQHHSCVVIKLNWTDIARIQNLCSYNSCRHLLA